MLYYIYGDNWMAEGVKAILRKRKDNFCVYNAKNISEKGVVLICTNKDIPEFPLLNTINLWKELKYKFIEAPWIYNVWNNFVEKTEGCEGIVTGISYIRDAVNCDLLKYNFGTLANSSQDITMDYKMFRHGESYCKKKIKYAIVGLAPYSLRYDEALSKAQYYNVRTYCELFKFNGVLNYEKNVSSEFLNDEEIKYIFEVYYLEKHSNLVNFYDYSKKYNNVLMNENVRKAADDEMKGKYEKPYADTIVKNKQVLKDFLFYLNRKSIKTLVLMPPFPSWYKTRWNYSYYEEMYEYVNGLREVLKFTLIDLSNEELPDNYFMDYAHLNSKGREYIANILNREL